MLAIEETPIRTKSQSIGVFKVKITVLGELGNGKSSFISAFASITDNEKLGDLAEALKSTKLNVGCDFLCRTVTRKNGDRVKLSIWDTAGQEKYRAMNRNFYAGSHGVILCFDLTKDVKESEVMDWVNEIDNNIDKECFRMIIGTKCDLASSNNSTSHLLQNFCTVLNITYLETSALTGKNVKETFDALLAEIEKKQEDYKQRAMSSVLYNRMDPSLMSLADNGYTPDSSGPQKVVKSQACC